MSVFWGRGAWPASRENRHEILAGLGLKGSTLWGEVRVLVARRQPSNRKRLLNHNAHTDRV
jgi:hypothetical protein